MLPLNIPKFQGSIRMYFIVYVWSIHDGGNVEQWTIGYGCRQDQEAKLKIWTEMKSIIHVMSNPDFYALNSSACKNVSHFKTTTFCIKAYNKSIERCISDVARFKQRSFNLFEEAFYKANALPLSHFTRIKDFYVSSG